MQREPIKILHVVFSLEPGGTENGIINVARALKREEFDVHVCCLERRGSFAERMPDPNNVYVLNKQEGFSVGAVFGLARRVLQLKPHLLHSHNLGPLIYSSLATGLGRWRPILHGEHGSLQPDNLQPRRLRQRRWFYHCCARILTVSRGVGQQLTELGLPTSKVTTLINGVDTERFYPGSRQAARKQIGTLPEDGLVIGIVGRFVALKRHAELIEAFTRLAGQRTDVHLLIVGGGGTETQHIENKVKASRAATRIHLTGFQDHPLPYYQAMDLLAVPSIHEGMSNVVLEAMACGVPVLAHEVCGNAEMIRQGENGIVADLTTVEQLHAALAGALAQPERLARMGRQARETTAREFSLARMVANYETVYRELSKPRGM